jgi:hypothetical protein
MGGRNVGGWDYKEKEWWIYEGNSELVVHCCLHAIVVAWKCARKYLLRNHSLWALLACNSRQCP